MHEYTKALHLDTETATLNSRGEDKRLPHMRERVHWSKDVCPLSHNNPCPVSDWLKGHASLSKDKLELFCCYCVGHLDNAYTVLDMSWTNLLKPRAHEIIQKLLQQINTSGYWLVLLA